MAEQGVHAVFFRNPVLQGFRSEQEKRPIYEDEDWIRITIAGLDKDIVEREATNLDRERFGEEWEKYQKGLVQAKSGTPLEMWPRMTPSMVANLKALNILSVEDMATLSDIGVQKVGMGGYELRVEAQRYLNSASQTSAVAELDRLQATCDAQAKQLAEQGQQIAELTALVQEAARRMSEPQPQPKPRKRKETA